MAEEKTTVYYDSQINDSTLNGSGYTAFKLPLNGNGSKSKMILWNDNDRKKITYANFYYNDVDKSVNSLKQQLIDEQHIDNITIENLVTLYRNHCLILKEDKDSIFFKNGKGNGGKARPNKFETETVAEEKEPPKQQLAAYKYSNKGRDSLHEAVILSGGRPVFLTYINGKIESYDAIEENLRVIKPPHMEHYPYEPVEFANMDEVLSFTGGFRAFTPLTY